MLNEANREIQRLLLGEELRHRQAGRLIAVVRAIDSLLFQLEEQNLQGVDRVPAGLRDRAGAILDVIPDKPAQDEGFRVRYRVVPMMDVLFQAQEILFKLRDPERAQEADLEDAGLRGGA